jgi:segregation and condensation protein B
MEENIQKQNKSNNLSNEIEAILFWKGEPVSVKKLSQIFEKTEEEIKIAIEELEEKIKDRGIVLVSKDDEYTLATSKDVSEIIEKLTKEELIKDLGKAGLETLSIIIYQGPISRVEIDYIRGVQSNFILRNLMIRGLVEKISNPKDQRSFLYRPTFEMLSYLGVSKIEELPEFEKAKNEIESYKNGNKQEDDIVVEKISGNSDTEKEKTEDLEQNNI